jgi:pyruvate/2-oxoglutarate dehydrogenase complex dihydrolipoamide acyltransferase (E2) component
MSLELKMTQSGMGITEATVAKWHKQPGQAVSQGEVLVDIETAKAVEEILSPINGVLERILVAEGVTAEMNTTIGLLRESDGTQ